MDKYIISIISITVGAVVSYLITTYRNRIQATFELHNEFHSDTMLITRARAFECVKKYSLKTFSNLESLQKDEDLFRSLWVVTDFYQRLWFSIKYNRIDKKMAPEMFGELFYWWYIASFQNMLLPTDWISSDKISNLKNWFDNNTSIEEKNIWCTRAEKFLESQEIKCSLEES